MGIRPHRCLVPALFTSALGLLIGCAGGGDSAGGNSQLAPGSYASTLNLSDGRQASVRVTVTSNGLATGTVSVTGSPIDGNGPAIQNAVFTFSGTSDQSRGNFTLRCTLESGEVINLTGNLTATGGEFTVSTAAYRFSGTLIRLQPDGGNTGTDGTGATGGSTGGSAGTDGSTAATTDGTGSTAGTTNAGSTDAGTTDAGTNGSNTDAGTSAGTDAGTDGTTSGTTSNTDGSGTDGSTDAGTTDVGTTGSNTDGSGTDGSTIGTTDGTNVGTSGSNG
ncbi:hypothetical protein EON81_19585 [bacterium]|nr:MAG: hypothetical protein EON81_19585 [bacterium]